MKRLQVITIMKAMQEYWLLAANACLLYSTKQFSMQTTIAATTTQHHGDFFFSSKNDDLKSIKTKDTQFSSPELV